jgi:hypothetical protein
VKHIAKWYKWILLAVIFQFAVLIYINNVFLKQDATVTVTNAEIKTGDFKVPEGAQSIELSYNANFVAYLMDGVLHIKNLDENTDKKIAGLDEDKITFFRWLPDRDMVIFSSDTKNGRAGTVQMSTYEADSETKRDLPEISDLNSDSQVKNIELSPYTNVVYAKIKVSDSKSRIVRFNVMSQYAHVMNLGADAVIKECSYVNKLIYQNPGESVYVYDGNNKTRKKISIDAEKTTVLDIDLNDTLYIGILDSTGKVTQILSQKITDKDTTETWDKIVLKQSTAVENIIISENGNIYINTKEENKITNAVNDLKASYRGEFIEVLDGALVSKNENKIEITSLKEY